jgi:Tfp pilus assembly protein PilV
MNNTQNSKKSHRWSLNPSAARARAADRARGRESDEGLSLVEVLIAFVILMITMVPIGFLLDSTVAAANQARQREAANQLADSWMEVLSNASPPATNGVITNGWTTPSAPQGAQTPTSTLPGTTFTIQSQYSLQSVNDEVGGSSDLCSNGEPPSPSHPGVIQLHVRVTWPGGALTNTTNIPYPQPGLQTEGYLSLLLTNSGQTGASPYTNSASLRLSAVPVSITDTATGTNYVLYPDPNGCLFAQLPTGPYTVSLEQPTTSESGGPSGFVYPGTPPFVTETGSQTDTASTTLTIAAEQTVQLSGPANAFDAGINTLLTYGGGSAVDGGVECPGTSALTCLATGDGTSGASTTWGGASSTWSSATLSNATHLNQVACTSATSPTCIGVGYTTSGTTDTGAIVTTTSDFLATSTDVLPSGVADVTQVVCPSATGCYAFATSTTGTPELLAGAPGTDTWVKLTTTFTSLSSIACPTSTTCEVSGVAVLGSGGPVPVIIRLDGDPGTLATNSAWAPTITADTLPSTFTSAGEIVCPDSAQCLALGAGDSHSSSDPTIFTTDPLSSVAGQASTWIDETFPTGTASLTGISCTSVDCVAIGTMPGTTPTAAVWTGSLSGSGSSDQWQQSTNIPAVKGFTSVACGQPDSTDTASCDIAAITSPTSGELVSGTLVQNGGWVWNGLSNPSGSGLEYYTGVACETPPSSSNSTCAASGVTPSGPVIITSSSGPNGTWTTSTPSSLTGKLVSGIPLQTTPASQLNWTTAVAAGGSTNATTLPGYLYPYANGYSIAAGDCLTEAGNSGAQASLSALPGGTANATIPLGLLPLQVVNTSGTPISGASLTLKATSSGCPADTYTLPLTDAAGITRTSVPYGTYSLTGSAGATTIPTNPTGSTVAVSILVGASSVTVTTSTTVTATSTTTSVATTTYLPNVAQAP